MAIPPDLLHQLRRIREVGSPVRRMSLLLAVWRRVRKLTSAERREAVRQIGVEPFKPLLEKLGKWSGGRLEPDEIVAAMDRLEEMDPSKVGALFQLFRSPRGRRELAQKGIDFLEELLGKTEAEPSAPPLEEKPPGRPEPSSASLGSGSRSSETLPEVSPIELPLPVPEIFKAQPPSVRADKPPRAEPRAEKQGASASAPDFISEVPPAHSPGPPGMEPPSEKRPSSPAVPVAPSELKTPARRTDRVREPGSPGRPTAVPSVVSQAREVPPTLTADRLLEKLATAPPLLRRFRYVSEFLKSGRELSNEEIREVLAGYPDGWPRRRALAAFLREGLPRDLEDAAALIEELSRLSDRRWCAGILLRTRSLDPADVERLEKVVPLPPLAQRLRKKIRVHRGLR